jgi:hypothetical protein
LPNVPTTASRNAAKSFRNFLSFRASINGSCSISQNQPRSVNGVILAELLGMNRLRGLNAVQQRLKNQIGKAAVLAVDV